MAGYDRVYGIYERLEATSIDRTALMPFIEQYSRLRMQMCVSDFSDTCTKLNTNIVAATDSETENCS